MRELPGHFIGLSVPVIVTACIFIPHLLPVTHLQPSYTTNIKQSLTSTSLHLNIQTTKQKQLTSSKWILGVVLKFLCRSVLSSLLVYFRLWARRSWCWSASPSLWFICLGGLCGNGINFLWERYIWRHQYKTILKFNYSMSRQRECRNINWIYWPP